MSALFSLLHTDLRRIISVIAADIFLLSCTVTTFILPYLPIRYDVWGLASHYSLYLQISAIVTIVGLWGCFRVCYPKNQTQIYHANNHPQKTPKLTKLFSHYIIFDLFISALPRFLLLLSMFDMSEEVPGTMPDANASPVLLTGRIADPSGIPLLDALITEAIVHITTQFRCATSSLTPAQYVVLAMTLKLGFVAVLLGCSGCQIAAAKCIGEYTSRLERLEQDALSEAGREWGWRTMGRNRSRGLSEPWRMRDSELEEWEEFRDTVEEKAA